MGLLKKKNDRLIFLKLRKFKNRKFYLHKGCLTWKINFLKSVKYLFFRLDLGKNVIRLNWGLENFFFEGWVNTCSFYSQRFCKKSQIYVPFYYVLRFWNALPVRNRLYAVSLFKTFLNQLSGKLWMFYMGGVKDKLEITGYARRAWLSGTNKKILRLKIGKSFLSYVFIPPLVRLILTRRRLIRLQSVSPRLLSLFKNKIFFLRPADVYKNAGIILNSKRRTKLKKFKKRK